MFDHSGQLQLVVTVIGPAASVETEAVGALARRLLAFTGGLSRQLGYDVQTDGSPFLRVVKA